MAQTMNFLSEEKSRQEELDSRSHPVETPLDFFETQSPPSKKPRYDDDQQADHSSRSWWRFGEIQGSNLQTESFQPDLQQGLNEGGHVATNWQNHSQALAMKSRKACSAEVHASTSPSHCCHTATSFQPYQSPQGANGIINKRKVEHDHISNLIEPPIAKTINTEDTSTVRFRSHQAENWTEKFEELLDFCLKNGHCLVPNAFKQNPSLAEWVKRQRYQYKLKNLGKHSTMSNDRIAALEKLGFVWNSHDAVWEERLKVLKVYKAIFNDCNVPSDYAPNPQLAIWVKRQRRQYKFLCDEEASTMTTHRIERLNELGFAWSGRKPKQSYPEEAWEKTKTVLKR